MSRAASGEQIVVRPSNNVFTALAAATVVIQILGLLVVFLAASANGYNLLQATQ